MPSGTQYIGVSVPVYITNPTRAIASSAATASAAGGKSVGAGGAVVVGAGAAVVAAAAAAACAAAAARVCIYSRHFWRKVNFPFNDFSLEKNSLMSIYL